MKITKVESWHESTELVRPYSIAYETFDAIDLFYVRIRADDGTVGLGAAAPNNFSFFRNDHIDHQCPIIIGWVPIFTFFLINDSHCTIFFDTVLI